MNRKVLIMVPHMPMIFNWVNAPREVSVSDEEKISFGFIFFIMCEMDLIKLKSLFIQNSKLLILASP